MAETAGLDDDELAAWRSFVEMRHVLERHLIWHLQREFGPERLAVIGAASEDVIAAIERHLSDESLG